MVILSEQQVKAVQIKTPWGTESVISFMNQFFVPTHSFRQLEEAVRTCRQNLSAGLFSIVVQDKEKA